jgi:hypothetical protein
MCKYTTMYQSNTKKKLYYVYYCIGATFFDSYRIIFTSFIEIDGFSLSSYKCNVFHPEVCNTCVYIQRCISQTQQNFIMFIIVLGQPVSVLRRACR